MSRMTRLISRAILTIAISAAIAGCKTTSREGDFVTIKPSPEQIQSAAKRVVCDSFAPITFSGKGDTAETVKQVREHNAAWGSFGC